jgi:hypothetical protein
MCCAKNYNNVLIKLELTLHELYMSSSAKMVHQLDNVNKLHTYIAFFQSLQDYTIFFKDHTYISLQQKYWNSFCRAVEKILSENVQQASSQPPESSLHCPSRARQVAHIYLPQIARLEPQ